MQCDLCGGRRLRVLAGKNGCEILRCPDCSLVQADVPENVEDIYKDTGYFARQSASTPNVVPVLCRAK